MAERPTYCHVVDVLRKFDPTLTEAEVDNNDYIANNDREQIRARIDAVGSKAEQETGQAWRLTRVGSPNTPSTYEHQDLTTDRPAEPLRISLDHRAVLPLDSTQNDTLEIRTGKDSWDDITAQAGTEFVLDHRTGTLELYRRLIRRGFWNAPDNRFLRATYRYGALGGDQQLGGQTTLDGDINNDATSVSVTDAARLPSHGVVLIANSEYARITNVDHSTNTLTLARGINATSSESHSDGDTVHYAPEHVRDAVAAKTARELLRYEDWVDQLVDTGDGPGAADKMDAWEDAWTRLCATESDVRLM